MLKKKIECYIDHTVEKRRSMHNLLPLHLLQETETAKFCLRNFSESKLNFSTVIWHNRYILNFFGDIISFEEFSLKIIKCSVSLSKCPWKRQKKH